MATEDTRCNLQEDIGDSAGTRTISEEYSAQRSVGPHFLLYLIAAFSHLHTCPCAELAVSQAFAKWVAQSLDFSAWPAWRLSTP